MSEDYKTGYLKALDRIVDLEAKLAVYEKEIMDNEKCFTEKDVESLIKDREETVKFLKQQLAEKDAEIRVAYSFRKQKCDNLQKALAEKEEEFMQVVKDWKSLVESKNQDKISFAVEQLEKVKELAHNHINEIVNDLSEEDDERLNQKHTIHGLATVITDIDNQIASLKKGVE